MRTSCPLPSGVPAAISIAGLSLSRSLEASPLLTRLRESCTRRGVTAYIVGGTVRDALAGRATADIDLAIASNGMGVLAQALGDELNATVVSLDPERQNFRIVPREGAVYADLTALRGGSIEADLALRDFTIDAFAFPLDGVALPTLSGKGLGGRSLLDPTGGLADLQTRTIRMTSPTVFQDDPVRLLRAVRLAAELGFTIEPQTAERARADAPLLASVSGERVRDEVCRILAAPGATQHLRLLDSLNLLTAVFPELEEARDVGQPKEHYWDVLNHSLETVGFMEQVLRQAPSPEHVRAGIPWNDATARYFAQEVSGGRTRLVLAKLACLLHDVAKPATKTIEPNGRMRFLGHPVKGADMTERIMEHLRFSNREVRMVTVMVNEHLRPGLISRGDVLPTRRAVFRYFRDAQDVEMDTLYLAFADYLAARGPMMEEEDWRRYCARICYILNDWHHRTSATPKVRLIDGHDIMKAFGLQPGPQLKVLLEAVTESQAAGEITTGRQALDLVARKLKKRLPA